MITNSSGEQPFFFIRVEGKYIRIRFSEIRYIESLKNYCKLVTGTGSYMVLISMKQVEDALQRHLFCRIHRSFIVSINHITAFDEDSVYIGDLELPLTSRSKRVLQQKRKDTGQ